MKTTTVSEEHAGRRLDSFTTEHLSRFSRSSVQALCDEGMVLVNNKPAKPSYKLRSGDNVTVKYDAHNQTIPSIDLLIIYEDADCIVINKPAGILTHSKGVFNPEATVASFIRPRLEDLTGERAGIVHRLDRATSGIIICAKNPEALGWLQKQFSQRKAKKIYLAVVNGIPKPQEAIIDMPIERNPRKPQTFRTSKSGKKALTNYKILQTSSSHSLLELRPQTGRTHQLRVHLRRLGYPIVGDIIYGGLPYSRLLLHSASLEVTLPNRLRKIFEASIPSEFKEIMELDN